MTRAELAEYAWLVAELRRAGEGGTPPDAPVGAAVDVKALIGTAALERAIAERRSEVEAYVSEKKSVCERQVLTLRVLLGLPWKRVALGCGLGVSEAAARKRYERAVADLD